MASTVEKPAADRQRDRRNLAIAGGVVALILLIYLVTFVRISGAAKTSAAGPVEEGAAVETIDAAAEADDERNR